MSQSAELAQALAQAPPAEHFPPPAQSLSAKQLPTAFLQEPVSQTSGAGQSLSAWQASMHTPAAAQIFPTGQSLFRLHSGLGSSGRADSTVWGTEQDSAARQRPSAGPRRVFIRIMCVPPGYLTNSTSTVFAVTPFTFSFSFFTGFPSSSVAKASAAPARRTSSSARPAL